LQSAPLGHSAALAALERIDTGVIVVDASRTVLFSNPAAERALALNRDILTRAGRLVIDDSILDGQLAKQVRQAVLTANGASHPPGMAMAVPRAGRLPVTLLVSPWRANWAPNDVAQPAALIFVRDPEDSGSAAISTLRDLFGLTRAEASVAVAIGQGKSVTQISLEFAVSLGTVRTHLKRALAKTGTDRQAALAVLVTRSVAGIAVRA